jgi:hypothetical protein
MVLKVGDIDVISRGAWIPWNAVASWWKDDREDGK